MSERNIVQLQKEFKPKINVLKRMWKPVSMITGVISTLIAAYKFAIGYGLFTLPVLGLLILALLLLWSASVTGIRLFILRSLSFSIDVVLLGISTFGVWIVVRGHVGDGRGLALMLLAWTWFFYFVLFDWLFKGSPGKQIVGLRLISVQKNSFNFFKSFIRVFLSLVVPVTCSSFLFEAVAGQSDSSARLFVSNALQGALLVLVPISILLLGGNQGIIDRIVGVAVQVNAEALESEQSDSLTLKSLKIVLMGIPLKPISIPF